MLYGIYGYGINRPQRIQNSAVRIVTNTHTYDHINPIIQKQYRLPVRLRMHVMSLEIAYECINDIIHVYLFKLVPIRNSYPKHSSHPIRYYCMCLCLR